MLATQHFPANGTTNRTTDGAAPAESAELAAAGELAVLVTFDTQPGAVSPGAGAQQRHRQLQKQLRLLDEVAQMLHGLATADEAFQAAMAGAGLSEEYLAACSARYAAAEQGVATRHQAMADALAATEALAAADFQARAAYSAFRQVARTVVRSHSGRAALKLDERTPEHRMLFLHTAEATLTAAQGEPYATLLGAATFEPTRVAATLAMLDALAAAQAAQATAQHHARMATLARDAAMSDLTTMARQIKVEVRTLLRRHPHLHAPVGF